MFGDVSLYVTKYNDKRWEFELWDGEKFAYRYVKKDFMGIKSKSHEIYRDLKVILHNGVDIRKILSSIEIDISRLNAAGELDLRESYELQEFLNLPDWEINGVIHNIIRVEKEKDGNKEIGLIKLYFDRRDGWIKKELIKSDRFIPDETGMSKDALNYEINFTNKEELLLKFRFLYYQVRRSIERFVSFTNEIEYDIDACTAIASYFREVFDTFPIIDYYSSVAGSGKTRAMKTLAWLSYNGFATSINVSEAVLFRAIEDAHCVIGLDEFHKLFTKTRDGELIASEPNKYAVINCGYSKGIPTYRVNMNTDPPTVTAYDNFGLKLITRLKPIPFDILSRCITHIMIRAAGRKKISPRDPRPDDFKKIRDYLYLFRLYITDIIDETYQELLEENVLEDRVRDLYYPLLTIAKLVDEELFNSLLEHAREKQTELVAEQQDSKKAVLLRTLVVKRMWGRQRLKDITNEFNEELIQSGEITDEKYKLHSKTVQSYLKQFGFKRSSYRPKNQLYYEIDPRILIYNVNVYFPTTSSFANFTNLTNLPSSNSHPGHSQPDPRLAKFSDHTNLNHKISAPYEILSADRSTWVSEISKISRILGGGEESHYQDKILSYTEKTSDTTENESKQCSNGIQKVTEKQVADEIKYDELLLYIESYIKEKDLGTGILQKELIAFLEMKGYKKEDVEEGLSKLVYYGKIYQPQVGRYKIL